MTPPVRIRDLIGGTEIVTEEDCWVLLETARLGRVGVSSPSGVDVLPVAYQVEAGRIEFATNLGTKLLGVFSGSSVFEVDHFDDKSQTGWSVVVRGRAEISELAEDEHQGLPKWAGTKKYLVQITPTSVTGRQLEKR